AWCAWGSDGAWPLVRDEDALALSWIWQEDKVGEDGATLIAGDDLGRYFWARVLLASGDAKEAARVGRALSSGEGELLRARAAVESGSSGEALVLAHKALSALEERKTPLLDDQLFQTVGDARLLFATERGGDDDEKQGWMEFKLAIKAYHKAPRTDP